MGSLKLYLQTVLNSYSEVFFSKNRFFSVILCIITFFDWVAGISGFIAIVTAIGVARWMQFDRTALINGNFTFNSLLVGLGIGINYQFNAALLFIVVFASLFTLFVSVSLQGVIGKYALPYLSIPFLLGIWTAFLASNHFESLGLSERGIYYLNELYVIGGKPLIDFYNWFNALGVPVSLQVYFRSLGAIFFQYNMLSGILITVGLLIYSRIAFSLSVIGFYSAYLFYEFIGADLSALNYSYIGFNYILASIAVGFFLIPSWQTYLWTILLIPLLAIITVSMNSVFAILKLPVYSLPFNIVVLLFLYVLKFRLNQHHSLREVYFQQYSPERNLYAANNHMLRFGNHVEHSIALPFFGEWKIMQAHDDEFTHKGEWRHAWDFIIVDNNDKQYKNDGYVLEDYYCYNKAVVAPGDGIVEEVINTVEDNPIGEPNIEKNWGNTVIIKHDDHLFSSLNHLRKETIKVHPGNKVSKGQIIANVGNSGRSAYPHLHFQLQQTPYVGSITLDYPISSYITRNAKEYQFHYYEKPLKNQFVSTIDTNKLLAKAFSFVPGKRLCWKYEKGAYTIVVHWIVDTTVYNIPFILEEDSGSKAYFRKDDGTFMFTHFEGDKSSVLYQFYLAAYKLQFGFYKGLTIEDRIPPNQIFQKVSLFFQDFVAAFTTFLIATYQISYDSIDSEISPSTIKLTTRIQKKFFGKPGKNTLLEIHVNASGINKIIVNSNQTIVSKECEGL